ncbi:cell division septation protein DedD [Polymorphobacter multimanifer]|uniref:Cell division septation protein DedD n=1 Tax=Polymorphobacter multimanifer TaxID=1070431 RepID=A0A841L426_9SPHN|nr:SPOR domain-containing protein [Polymorphobacter multimanifer]MBB6227394.1 cell division septation protein DedD [Polymorphobacter multimanifer]
MAHDDDAPWLAEAEPGSRGSGRGSGRSNGRGREQGASRAPLMRLIIVLLAVAVAAIIAVYVFTRPGQSNGDGYMEAAQAPLINALPGPFKVKPEDPRGLDVEGQDQTLYAAGAGIDDMSDINLGAAPEVPMARPGSGEAEPAAPPPTARNLLPPAMGGDAVATPAPAPAAAPAAAPPAALAPARAAPAPVPTITAPPPRAAPAAGGKTVQLGAFSSRARAESEWARLAARHGMLGFSPRYVPTERGGQTLWRLRASGGDTAALCARLAGAGDSCTVVSE